MALTTAQLQEAGAVAVQYINDSIPDLLQQLNALYKKMYERRKYVPGAATYLQFPVAYAENQAQGAISGDGSDLISLNQNQMLTFAQLQWKYYYTNVSISVQDLTQGGDSDDEIKSLIKAKIAQGKNSFVRLMSADLFGSAATNAKKLDGFGDIFGASGTAYAGLNNTDVANWFPLSDSTTQAINFASINSMFQQLKIRAGQYPTDGLDSTMKLDYMVSNWFVMNQYMASEQIKQRYIDPTKLESGFDGIRFNGADWYSDANAPGTADGSTADNKLYILSSNSMYWFYRYGFEKPCPMSTSGVVPNSPLEYNVGYSAWNIACSDRRVNGYMSTLKS